MVLLFGCNLSFLQRNIISTAQCLLCKRSYAVPSLGLGKRGKGGKKIGSTEAKRVLPVETDANKLVSFVCGSNILKEGKDIEIKPDSEYPDWLWTIRTGPAPSLEEMDPNTKSYWRRLRREGMKRHNKFAALKRF